MIGKNWSVFNQQYGRVECFRALVLLPLFKVKVLFKSHHSFFKWKIIFCGHMMLVDLETFNICQEQSKFNIL